MRNQSSPVQGDGYPFSPGAKRSA
uniref:Uncharacterized protein n=1 Tax=Arundo donax TaxID=35708 RepID=A0A0A8Y584_ARUDO